jgi:hypothetical protein
MYPQIERIFNLRADSKEEIKTEAGNKLFLLYQCYLRYVENSQLLSALL